jgi:hypothetical protein
MHFDIKKELHEKTLRMTAAQRKVNAAKRLLQVKIAQYDRLRAECEDILVAMRYAQEKGVHRKLKTHKEWRQLIEEVQDNENPVAKHYRGEINHDPSYLLTDE